MPKTHNLKCWPKYFQDVLRGAKPFELRLDDRGFEVGDSIVLREWDDDQRRYTGNEIDLKISSLIRLREYSDFPGWRWRLARWLMPDFVILGVLHKAANQIGWGWEDDDWSIDLDSEDYWLTECAKSNDGSCLLAGSEECEFECPYRRD